MLNLLIVAALLLGGPAAFSQTLPSRGPYAERPHRARRIRVEDAGTNMSSRSNRWLVSAILISCSSVAPSGIWTARASEVEGTFTATVALAGGVAPGSSFYLSSLVGSTITGSFSYDPQSLTATSSNLISSTWVTDGTGNPAVISASLHGSTYTVTGSGQTYVGLYADETGSSDPANQFTLIASSSRTISSDTVFTFVVANNNLGKPYITNLADPGTVSFAHQSYPLGNQASSIVFYNFAGNEVGDIEFGISDASASPVPLPASAWLMLSGVLGLGAFTRISKVSK